MRYVLILLSLTFTLNIYSKDEKNNSEKVVSLVTTGYGISKDEAKQMALRDALEQAFGVFISTNTKISNDDIISDEMTSLSNGNIQDFEVLSELKSSENQWLVTLKSTVSITELTSFVNNNVTGVNAKFKGNLFAFNVNQQILNEQNEIEAIKKTCETVIMLAENSFDYNISAGEPTSIDGGNNNWAIPLQVEVYKNSNFDRLSSLLYSTLKGVSLSIDEAKNYISLNKPVFPITIASSDEKTAFILLRKNESREEIFKTILFFREAIHDFKISNGVNSFTSLQNRKVLSIYNNSFIIRGVNSSRFKLFQEYGSAYSPFNPDFWDIDKWYHNGYNKKLIPDISSMPIDGRIAYRSNLSDKFKFVYDFRSEIESIGRGPGLIISFLPDYYRKNKKKKKWVINDLIVTISYEDIKTLEQINRIEEYRVVKKKLTNSEKIF